jgi:hypothetical protein
MSGITSMARAAPRSKSLIPRGGPIAGFYSALHTLDIPVLMEAPGVRTVLIIALCALGLAFSLSGVVIGWRRLRVSSTRRL